MEYKFTKDNFQKEVLESDIPVLVDFYADWCGPCKMQGPIVDQLSEERKDVKFCKINVDEAPAVAMELGISSIPTIMVVKNGEITFKQAGLMQKAQLAALL
jgi:thioredoxin 1